MELRLEPLSDIELSDFFETDIVEGEYNKLKIEINCLKYTMEDYIDQYEECETIPYDERLKYDQLVLEFHKLLQKYNALISKCRKAKIEQYNIRDKNEFPDGTLEFPDIAGITETGRVRFDEHAIQNGKNRVVDFDNSNELFELVVPQVELDQRDVSVSMYSMGLFDLCVDAVFEFVEKKRLCVLALQYLSQNLQQLKSILKMQVKLVETVADVNCIKEKDVQAGQQSQISDLNKQIKSMPKLAPIDLEISDSETDDFNYDLFETNLTLSPSFNERLK